MKIYHFRIIKQYIENLAIKLSNVSVLDVGKIIYKGRSDSKNEVFIFKTNI